MLDEIDPIRESDPMYVPGHPPDESQDRDDDDWRTDDCDIEDAEYERDRDRRRLPSKFTPVAAAVLDARRDREQGE